MTDARVATPSASAPVRLSDDERDTLFETGVDAYLASAERMRVVADVALKAGIVLALLILLAWALGLLPGAVRLF
jgi:hypothetical protein